MNQNITINIPGPEDFLNLLNSIQFGDEVVFAAATQDNEELCECGMPIDQCESQFRDVALTNDGLEALATETDYDQIESAEELEERRDAIAILGIAIRDNSEAIATYSRLVEAEYGIQG